MKYLNFTIENNVFRTANNTIPKVQKYYNNKEKKDETANRPKK